MTVFFVFILNPVNSYELNFVELKKKKKNQHCKERHFQIIQYYLVKKTPITIGY